MSEEKWLTEAKSTAKMQAEMFVDELNKIAIEDSLDPRWFIDTALNHARKYARRRSDEYNAKC